MFRGRALGFLPLGRDESFDRGAASTAETSGGTALRYVGCRAGAFLKEVPNRPVRHAPTVANDHGIRIALLKVKTNIKMVTTRVFWVGRLKAMGYRRKLLKNMDLVLDAGGPLATAGPRPRF